MLTAAQVVSGISPLPPAAFTRGLSASTIRPPSGTLERSTPLAHRTPGLVVAALLAGASVSSTSSSRPSTLRVMLIHTQREHAAFSERGAHLLVALKDNQRAVAKEAAGHLVTSPVVRETHDRTHGRMVHRRCYSVTSVRKKCAAHLRIRDREGLPRALRPRRPPRVPKDLVLRHDLIAAVLSREELACHILGHWHIEDRSQTRFGGAPQALASLRNLAISILRLAGFENVASGLRWTAFDNQEN